MQPAFSVIFFTVLSGTGYGLLFCTGVALAFLPRALDPVGTLLALGLGIALTVVGLMSSLAHLGQPQRAWRALSQWRSSWLSREGVASVVCFVPALALYALVWHFAIDMAARQLDPPVVLALRAAGVVLAACSVLTVFCTARIYTSLPTIAAWHNRFVLPGYLLFALLGGAAWLWMLALLAGGAPPLLARGLPVVVAASAVAVAWLKRAYWRFVDGAPAVATPGTATGLDRFGGVRSAEAPHTEQNYLTREMGFVLARKHAARLRALAIVLFALAPLLAAATAFFAPATSLATGIVAALAIVAGAFVERWLFFAQARHAVMSYYER